MNTKPVVVLDCGTSLCRAGFSHGHGKEIKDAIFRNVVGLPKHGTQETLGKRQHVFGDEVFALRDDLNIRYPYEHGYIARWQELELVWQELIQERLRVNTEEHPFLIVQTGFVPKLNLEKTAEIFFQYYGVPSICFRSSGGLSLLPSGTVTGTVVEIGGGACFPVAVVNGYELRHSMQRTEFSGRDLTYTLSKMLLKTSNTKTLVADMEIVKQIKEQHCYCAENFEEEIKIYNKDKDIIYSAPGHNDSIRIRKEQFQCPESLFKPSLAEKEFPGLHEIVFKCITSCQDISIQKDFFSNVVLCGGSSLLPGLNTRLQQELQDMVTSQGCKHHINVSTTPCQNAAFEGGKIASCQEDFLDRSLTKEQYDECGPYSISIL